MNFSATEITRDVAVVAERSRAALWLGICVGISLNIVMCAGLVVANRFPELDRYALERNAAGYGLFVILMLVPVGRFFDRPRRMFASAMVGWVVFVAGYNVAGLFFHNLFSVLRTPFQAFIEGTILYGVAATISWVVEMALHARRHPLTLRRPRAQQISSRHR